MPTYSHHAFESSDVSGQKLADLRKQLAARRQQRDEAAAIRERDPYSWDAPQRHALLVGEVERLERGVAMLEREAEMRKPADQRTDYRPSSGSVWISGSVGDSRTSGRG